MPQIYGYVHDQNHLHHDPLFQNHPLQRECVATQTRLNVEARCACEATHTFHTIPSFRTTLHNGNALQQQTRLNVETRCSCKATQTFHRPYPPVAATPCGCRSTLRWPPVAPPCPSAPSAPPGQLYSQCSSHGVRGDCIMTNETTTRPRHACTATSHCSPHGVRGEFTMANETTTLSRYACTATHKYVCIRMLFVDQ